MFVFGKANIQLFWVSHLLAGLGRPHEAFGPRTRQQAASDRAVSTIHGYQRMERLMIQWILSIFHFWRHPGR